ncbi:MAG: hypothetical protein CMP63_00070 [Flavobacteriales bacterium]|nr:hypothetical protein [Flavobacteriales bacterium]|tara:strand:+ start:3993 stop:4301 length:309 start_codon:yes stop_codon:yes gene_type:complete
MSALMNFAIFPLDKGEDIGDHVSKVVQHIKNSGYKYQFGSMGTTVEADKVGELLKLVEESYEILDPVSDRIYCVMNIDYSKNKSDLLNRKRNSIEKRIGSIS